MQGGAVQGIGWALNEEYIFDDNGVLENAGFLDYRIPVASDLPMMTQKLSRCLTQAIRLAFVAWARRRLLLRWRSVPTRCRGL